MGFEQRMLTSILPNSALSLTVFRMNGYKSLKWRQTLNKPLLNTYKTPENCGSLCHEVVESSHLVPNQENNRWDFFLFDFWVRVLFYSSLKGWDHRCEPPHPAGSDIYFTYGTVCSVNGCERSLLGDMDESELRSRVMSPVGDVDHRPFPLPVYRLLTLWRWSGCTHELLVLELKRKKVYPLVE